MALLILELVLAVPIGIAVFISSILLHTVAACEATLSWARGADWFDSRRVILSELVRYVMFQSSSQRGGVEITSKQE